MPIACQNYVFRLPDDGLYCSANRYTPDTSYRDGFTFILAHCANGHKEQWEVIVEALFDFASRLSGSTHRIREIWCLDSQNHGDSAVLNERMLTRGGKICSIEDYGDLLRHFCESDYVSGHRKIAVGHSASTSTWTFACSAFPNSLNIHAIIYIEPVAVTESIIESASAAGKRNTQAIQSKQEKWDDYEVLTKWMKGRYPWKLWDKRVFELHLKHGFRSATENGRSIIVPKCTKEYKYYEAEPHTIAGHRLSQHCQRYPIHSIFGERPEMVSLESRTSICDTSKGRKMASITVIPKAGHLAVQEQPEAVARAIFDAFVCTPAYQKASL